jgi:hypothetical protein
MSRRGTAEKRTAKSDPIFHLFGYGGEERGFSLYFTSGYSGSCIRVYSIQRYLEKGLASEIFLGVSRSFYMAMFYLYE